VGAKRPSSYQPGCAAQPRSEHTHSPPLLALAPHRHLHPPSTIHHPPSTIPRNLDVPCFCITCRNLTMTLDEGRMRTCLFPAFSALLIEFKQSLRTEVLTMFALMPGGAVVSVEPF